MRTRRWTPASADSSPNAALADEQHRRALEAGFFARLIVDELALEAPALGPFRYMRSSISAQSCDSVPPAPGWMVTMAFD